MNRSGTASVVFAVMLAMASLSPSLQTTPNIEPNRASSHSGEQSVRSHVETEIAARYMKLHLRAVGKDIT